ncbi:MAG: hypothetical protein AAFQ13_07220, partial [Pseudomonadota bacterium]
MTLHKDTIATNASAAVTSTSKSLPIAGPAKSLARWTPSVLAVPGERPRALKAPEETCAIGIAIC